MAFSSAIAARTAVLSFSILETCRIARVERRSLDISIGIGIHTITRCGRRRDQQVKGTPGADVLRGRSLLKGKFITRCRSQIGISAAVRIEIGRRESIDTSHARGILLVELDVGESGDSVGDEDNGHGEVVSINETDVVICLIARTRHVEFGERGRRIPCLDAFHRSTFSRQTASGQAVAIGECAIGPSPDTAFPGRTYRDISGVTAGEFKAVVGQAVIFRHAGPDGVCAFVGNKDLYCSIVLSRFHRASFMKESRSQD